MMGIQRKKSKAKALKKIKQVEA
jgi:hypothetical protein